MAKGAINQRLKFLITQLSPSVREFSEAIGESTSNTNNYIGARQTEPKPDYLAKVLNHFNTINAHWLLTGEGEPFLIAGAALQAQTNISGKKNAVNVTGTNHGTATQNNYTLTDCEKSLAAAQKENELLREQLVMKDVLLGAKDDLIAAKEEMLSLLRAGHNRPN